MKRIIIVTSIALLLSPLVQAQQDTPQPPLEPQAPRAPGPSMSSPPAQAVISVPVPIAPPKPNGPVQKSLVRITATSVEPEYKAPWNAGALQRGVGAGFVIGGERDTTKARFCARSPYLSHQNTGVPHQHSHHGPLLS